MLNITYKDRKTNIIWVTERTKVESNQQCENIEVVLSKAHTHIDRLRDVLWTLRVTH